MRYGANVSYNQDQSVKYSVHEDGEGNLIVERSVDARGSRDLIPEFTGVPTQFVIPKDEVSEFLFMMATAANEGMDESRARELYDANRNRAGFPNPRVAPSEVEAPQISQTPRDNEVIDGDAQRLANDGGPLPPRG